MLMISQMEKLGVRRMSNRLLRVCMEMGLPNLPDVSGDQGKVTLSLKVRFSLTFVGSGELRSRFWKPFKLPSINFC